jgi:hypothetical protein
VIFVDSMKYVTTTADTCYTTLDLQLKLAPWATYHSSSASTWQRSAAQCQCQWTTLQRPVWNLETPAVVLQSNFLKLHCSSHCHHQPKA